MHPIYTCTHILQECTYQAHMHIHTCPHTPHIPHRCVHSPHTYMHTMLVQASLPGAWPKVTTSGRMGKGKLPGPSQTLPQHPPAGKVLEETRVTRYMMSASAASAAGNWSGSYSGHCWQIQFLGQCLWSVGQRSARGNGEGTGAILGGMGEVILGYRAFWLRGALPLDEFSHSPQRWRGICATPSKLLRPDKQVKFRFQNLCNDVGLSPKNNTERKCSRLDLTVYRTILNQNIPQLKSHHGLMVWQTLI